MNPSQEDLNILAKTIYGEARGEYGHPAGGMTALIAIGNVVMNRWKEKGRYGKSVKEVCLKPWQFSCWNKNDPNRALIERMTDPDDIFEICQNVAQKVYKGEWTDVTLGSNHYYSSLLALPPKWAIHRKPQISIGRHIFFKL